ncbi:MAG: hypothetical protein B7Y43_05245 [Sphingomonas sp. 28-62-20]|uniref:hypothetical protein n=1 Tax=Sphingomonas sp. 28-62-20 TaxID=1970433 RepID=UPI000BD75772|nr:MAG: hypothetical protein B7Y43_05245 [Sphingomonas sp. 28-62-20]
MKRVAMIVALAVGWLGAMLTIGIAAYHVGEYGMPALTFAGIGPESRWGIIWKALVAATFLSLQYDFLKHRQGSQG